MKIAAIVPHWNRSDLLRALLPNLQQQVRPFDEIIVVDNGSTDDSAAIARQAGARLIELGNNVGFAAAVNRGVAASDADWVAILNNDVALEPSWLAILESRMDDADFLCGKLLSAANLNMLDGTFDELAASACAYRCGAGKPDGPVWTQPRAIRCAPMTAALFSKSLFVEINPLDEAFESYLEDVDFGLRCALAGKRGLFVPEALAVHQGSATSGAWHSNTVRLLARNQMLLSFKHFHGQALWPQVAGQLLWGLVAFRHGRFLAWWRGKWQGWSFRHKVSRSRYSPQQLADLLRQSEDSIWQIQEKTGFDAYWRLYFWLRGR